MIKALRFNFHRSSLFGLSLILACVLVPFAQAPTSAATISGATAATVVWINAPGAALPPSEDFQLTNHHRTFIPPYLVITVGSSVRFPNEDSYYHSIYSDSKADPFDIGYYTTGPGKLVAFDKPGVVNVRCHIHTYMHAAILVVNGPYTIVTQGRYTLGNVPAGAHSLHTWDLASGERSYPIAVPSQDATLTRDLK